MKKKALAILLTAGTFVCGSLAGSAGYLTSLSYAKEAAFTVANTDEIKEINNENPLSGVADVAEAVMPAVVSITNKSVQEVQDIFGMYGMFGFGFGNNRGRKQQYESTSCGSGIIIGQNESELLIASNNHVVEGAVELTVGFIDEEVYPAAIKGTDPDHDLAVVAVKLEDISEDTLEQIRIAQIGSSDDLRIGEQVVAIGNALGYGQSVTTGIVSAMNRELSIIDSEVGLIQTDAAINFGNSGGALLDMCGRVIGINSAKSASNGIEGMGYAIPISNALPILNDLMERETRTEKVDEEQKAYLGITGQSVSAEVSALYGIPKGVYLTEIGIDTPAEEAGLEQGDIITAFDGTKIESMDDFLNTMNYYAAGEEVELKVAKQSDGYEEETVKVTLGAYEKRNG